LGGFLSVENFSEAPLGVNVGVATCCACETVPRVTVTNAKSKMAGKGLVRLRAIEAQFLGATLTGGYFWQIVTGLYIR